ncbi:hypothetical protein GEV33_010449 [Tenebrio molitor]|uniref:CCHC-type domain-containing protein n=1 Tax=Tenebrio molitor TaxID=7067 RepID=A0A8J6HDZ6_TENMO|nr:hypothetical protein GEV33_010449 [Tenebrio molitor]
MLISDVPEGTTQEQLVEELTGQNLPDSVPKNFIGKIFKQNRRTQRNTESRSSAGSANFVVEVHPAARRFYLQTGRVYTAWRSHHIRDFLEVTRCYNCQRYGHISRNCNSPTACGYCSSTEHDSNACRHLVPRTLPTTQQLTCAQYINIGYKTSLMQHYTTLMDRHGIIQINLQKSRTATNGLVAHMLDNNISLALIQEPYVCRHGSAFKIPHLNGLQLAAVTSAKFLSAIIFNKDCLQPLFVPQLSTDRIVVITAQIGQTIVYFASVYLPPSVDIRSEIPTIQRLVEATAGSRLVIGGDFNTRSTLWFDSLNDTRSPILHEFITQNDLDITNKPGTLPTFQNSRGQSFIDITLTTPPVTPNISNWQVSNSLITSDHNAISFTFTNDPAISTATTAPRQVMDYSRVTSEHVAETLQDWNSEFDRTFPALSNPETIDQAVNYLYSTIRTCVAAKAVRRKRFAHRPDWWTDEVERHRKIYMTKKSLFYKNRHPEYGNYLHTEMRAARDRFKRKLTAARQKSWDLFVQRDLAENPWGVTYRLAAEKFHKAGVLSCFTREDNSATLTPQDTLEYLLHKLLPDDDPSTNTHLQQNAQRDFTALEPLPHGAAPFTEDDLNRLIQEIKPNKAPGTDRLPGRLIKLLHPWTGRSLLRIYNACWSSGYFPQAWKRGNLVVLLKDPSGDK